MAHGSYLNFTTSTSITSPRSPYSHGPRITRNTTQVTSRAASLITSLPCTAAAPVCGAVDWSVLLPPAVRSF